MTGNYSGWGMGCSCECHKLCTICLATTIATKEMQVVFTGVLHSFPCGGGGTCEVFWNGMVTLLAYLGSGDLGVTFTIHECQFGYSGGAIHDCNISEIHASIRYDEVSDQTTVAITPMAYGGFGEGIVGTFQRVYAGQIDCESFTGQVITNLTTTVSLCDFRSATCTVSIV